MWPHHTHSHGSGKGKMLFLASLALIGIIYGRGVIQDLTLKTSTSISMPRQLSQTAAVNDSVSPALVADEVPLVYTYECPDHNGIDTFLHKGIDPDGANLLSHLSGALTTVSKTLAGLRDTKIVLIGDSVMHQIYSSLSCMSHRAGAWESNTSFVGDRRVWLKNGSEIIFSPWAGNLLQFDWNIGINELTTNRPQMIMILSMTTRTG